MTVRIKDLPADATPIDADTLVLDSAGDGCRRATFETIRKVVLSAAFSRTDTATLVRTGADTYAARKDNLVAGAANPTVNDDENDGYGVGSFWVNTGTEHTWICLDPKAGAAQWIDLESLTAANLVLGSDARGDLYRRGASGLERLALGGTGCGVISDGTDAKWSGAAVVLTNDARLSAASTSASGIVELATSAETITGTDADRAVTPAGLQAKTASDTAIGLVELATVAEAVAGTDTARAVTAAGLAAHVAQPKARPYTGTTDTIVAGDIGNVVKYSQAGAVTAALPDLSGSLTSGCAMVLTLQCVDPATVLTIDPGTSVTINGSTSNYVLPTGRLRASLISFDGLAWFDGVTP